MALWRDVSWEGRGEEEEEKAGLLFIAITPKSPSRLSFNSNILVSTTFRLTTYFGVFFATS